MYFIQVLTFSLILSLWVFPLHGLTNTKTQLLLAFELYRGTFNHHTFTKCSFRFARQYNGPPKSQPGAELNRVISHNFIVCTLLRMESAWPQCEARAVCVYAKQIQEQTAILGVETLGRLLTHLSLLFSLWEIPIDRNTTSASPSCTLTHWGAGGKKTAQRQLGRTWQLWPLPRAADIPQLRTTWLGRSEQAKASMSANNWGLESRSELFDPTWSQTMERNRACFPHHIARSFTTPTLLLRHIGSG